ncbi:hypothetical protein FACUT_829 [Fusarium acutatum]|uniref:Uncharacterized protein n=1 Tax=Fusarium acutatum TaxID=78861 RepID=A0A8H4K7I3_9HYPO|nr:hypothetical protein FACUT_829 [Fusarium acutatum]
MKAATSQEHSEPRPEQEQLNEISRHFYYVRKREVRMYPGAKALLKMSVQKYMAKYEVEFLGDDQRLRVSVPLEVIMKDSEERFHCVMEISDAMMKAKLLTFFRTDAIENAKNQVQISQIRISGLERRDASTTQEREELKVALDMLRIHEEAMARQKRFLEEWKS